MADALSPAPVSPGEAIGPDQAGGRMPDAAPFGALRPTLAQRAVIGFARATPLGRGQSGRLFRDVLRRLRPGPVDAGVLGGVARLRLDDNPCEWKTLLNPRYNRIERDFLLEAIRPGGTFVDVGANAGIYSLAVMAARAPDVRVLAIEPHPEARRRLGFNLAANGFCAVRVVAAAVGDHDGEIAIRTDATNLGASRIDGAGDVRVPMRRLLDLIDEAGIEAIDALKIDIEGFEDRALAPFFRDAPRALWPRRVAIENSAHLWQEDCLALMQASGYVLRAGTRSNSLLELAS